MLKKRGLWAKLSFDNLPTDIAAIFRSATTSFYSSTATQYFAQNILWYFQDHNTDEDVQATKWQTGMAL